ncbi:hypothetical protein Tsubulata_042048 [Turnera subulata]|uniref:Uncharacterized protein n=1 Tax=Turnera subulata TaxID=218843 RepID=A0A9Q0JIB1_9ROSI|nr:hypothetical protein Tsubulata_042048 [Turnera subulata]
MSVLVDALGSWVGFGVLRGGCRFRDFHVGSVSALLCHGAAALFSEEGGSSMETFMKKLPWES